MILPQKHIRLSESLFALAAYVLKFAKKPTAIDELWEKFLKLNNSADLPAYHEMDSLILALDFLFMMGLVDIDKIGNIYAINKINS